MAKRTIRFTHKGLEISRTTARVYTHVVVSRSNYDRDLAQSLEGDARRARFDYDRFAEIAAKRGSWRYADLYTPAEMEGFLADADAAVAAGRVRWVADRTAAAQDHTRAAYAARRANGYYDRLLDRGWCGRRDLAEKLAAKCRAAGDLDVEVVEIPEAAR